MTHLIHNMIDSSRVIDGDIQLYFHPSTTDLTLLLHEVCQLQREIAPGAQILESFDTKPLHIVGDANLLFQVFSNLLSNAGVGLYFVKMVVELRGGNVVAETREAEGSRFAVRLPLNPRPHRESSLLEPLGA
jgi:signal transduction histidine kinase